MKAFVLLISIPSLIIADILCPNSKTTCPEDKHCCEVDGEFVCCDHEHEQDVPDVGMKLEVPGDEIMSSTKFENLTYANKSGMTRYCDHSICPASCCDDGCCPYYSATCCGEHYCCPALSSCCHPGCCLDQKVCCGGLGCCAKSATCCGTWCCREGYKCSSTYKMCYRGKGVIVSPKILNLILMVGTAFVSRLL